MRNKSPNHKNNLFEKQLLKNNSSNCEVKYIYIYINKSRKKMVSKRGYQLSSPGT